MSKISSDILKDAIAEAKLVKQVALKNAKQTLEESFAPKIQKILSQTLKNEVSDEDSEDSEDSEELDLDETEDPGEDETGETKDNEDVTDDLDETEDPGKGESGETKNNKDVTQNLSEEDSENFEDEDEDEDLDNIDLEEVLTSLEEEDSENSEDEDPELEEEDKVTKADDVTPMSDEDEEEEMTVEEILNGINEEDSEEDYETDEDEEDKLELETLRKENVQLKKSVKKHSNAINFMKKALAEVNLLNEKLLHTTNIFRNFNLSNTDKMKVVESFDRTKSVREVKLIYATIVESFRLKAGNSKKTAVKKLQEGSGASKVIASQKSDKTVITEGDDFKARMQKLANIKRKK
jgi:hypothetical protein